MKPDLKVKVPDRQVLGVIPLKTPMMGVMPHSVHTPVGLGGNCLTPTLSRVSNTMMERTESSDGEDDGAELPWTKSQDETLLKVSFEYWIKLMKYETLTSRLMIL